MAKKKRTRWSPEKKEKWVTSSAVTLPFILFLFFLAFMTYLVLSSENLRLENEVERAFGEVLVALQREDETVPVALQNRNVLGFGYYTSTGSPIYTWGDAYRILPFSIFTDSTSISDTMISFDMDTGIIECIRYVDSITFDLDNIFRRTGDVLELPDLIYLSFDASHFLERIALTRVFSLAIFVAVIIIYIIIMKILGDNRRIRETMRKQENLISLGQAARTLTHEIKNPLSSIAIQIAILKREVRPEVLPDVLMIDHETLRLKQLTDRVSEFLRNPIGQPEMLNLVEAVRELMPVFHGSVKMIDPVFAVAPVYFDREKLRSVLENLMKNAVEACDGMEMDAEVEITSDDKTFHFFVRDRGCGIKAEDKKRIFDPFFTTKINGSGIGLAISSQFMKAAGGSLRLYPRQGGGTIAEAVFPNGLK